MPVRQPFATGRHITSFRATPIANVNGTFTEQTAATQQFYGHLASVEIETQGKFETFSPMDSTKENNILIEAGTTVRITEYEKYFGINRAARLAYNVGLTSVTGTGELYKVEAVRGEQTWTYYGHLASYSMRATKGSVIGTLEFRSVDVRTSSANDMANPIYVDTATGTL